MMMVVVSTISAITIIAGKCCSRIIIGIVVAVIISRWVRVWIIRIVIISVIIIRGIVIISSGVGAIINSMIIGSYIT